MGWTRQPNDEAFDGKRFADECTRTVERGWKYENILSTDATEDAQIFKDEISEFLLDEMDETFNCSLEDGSDQEVSVMGCCDIKIAEIILNFYNTSRSGDMSVVHTFIEKNRGL